MFVCLLLWTWLSLFCLSLFSQILVPIWVVTPPPPWIVLSTDYALTYAKYNFTLNKLSYQIMEFLVEQLFYMQYKTLVCGATRSALPCTVRTSRQRSCNQRVGWLLQFGSSAFGPAKQYGPWLLSTFPWDMTRIIDILIFWKLNGYNLCMPKLTNKKTVTDGQTDGQMKK